MKVYICFPGGKAKALTMSYDDGKIQEDRKSVVQGTSVDLGGRRIIKKRKS